MITTNKQTTSTDHATEIARGERFRFGENWRRFLALLTDERIAVAEHSLCEMLDCESLADRNFLDIGSGSGLFSLAARRLGATVRSFDYDPQSVACTQELKRRYFPEDADWVISEGSVLDPALLDSLGTFDIVYSWGVLHHTGSMWQALDNAQAAVGNDGLLFVALYNEQGAKSRFWTAVKKTYCSSWPARAVLTAGFFSCRLTVHFLTDLLRLRWPWRRYVEYKRRRGMSAFRDWFDWLGGYPFEVAKPEEVFDFCRRKGFELRKLKTVNGLGNNEFVFQKLATSAQDA